MLSQSLSFLPGSKLEAKDFNEKWYAARVVETDWIEREVLIHFDKWSTRFDEWIPMDSSRLRLSQINHEDLKVKTFTVGEKILATWVDGKKYPAKVSAVLGNDKYDVLFDDGYSKILKTSKITKLFEEKIIKPNEEHTYVGSKQERRDKKRKHTVSELFYSHSKKKIKNNDKIHNKLDYVHLNDLKLSSQDSKINSNYMTPNFENSFEQNIINNKTDKTEDVPKFHHKLVSSNTKWIYANHVDDYATFVGNLRVEIEDSTYKCPKTGCNKNFRKENLLQMHIKHYHPEYSKFLGSTPNVADLAYARTIGESFDEHNFKKVKNYTLQSNFNPETSPMNTSDINSADIELNLELKSKQVNENKSFITDDQNEEQTNNSNLSTDDSLKVDSNKFEFLSDSKSVLHLKEPWKDDSLESKQLQYSYIDKFEGNGIFNKKKKIIKKKPINYISGPQIKKQSTLQYEDHYPYTSDVLEENNLNSISNYNDDSVPTKINDLITMNREVVKVEKLRREEIINCTCGITEEDGLMIQCDLCLCWQHGHCNSIEKENDVPEKYICYICQHAHQQRTSKKYFHDQDWIQEGFLPRLDSKESFEYKKKSAKLKRLNDLIAKLIQVKHFLHSLRVKINVVLIKDHPKLYLWDKSWNKVTVSDLKSEPVPFLKIVKETNECKNSTQPTVSTKLITSNSELMRILEEDNGQSEESKFQAAYILNDIGNVIEESKSNIEHDSIVKSKTIPLELQSPSVKNDTKNNYLKAKRTASYRSLLESSNRPKQNLLSTDNKELFTSQPIIPQPEALIDPVECKFRLLQHIEQSQNYVESLLVFVEAQLLAFENNIEDKKNYYHYIQTIQMLSHDLQSMVKLAAACL